MNRFTNASHVWYRVHARHPKSGKAIQNQRKSHHCPDRLSGGERQSRGIRGWHRPFHGKAGQLQTARKDHEEIHGTRRSGAIDQVCWRREFWVFYPKICLLSVFFVEFFFGISLGCVSSFSYFIASASPGVPLSINKRLEFLSVECHPYFFCSPVTLSLFSLLLSRRLCHS